MEDKKSPALGKAGRIKTISICGESQGLGARDLLSYKIFVTHKSQLN